MAIRNDFAPGEVLAAADLNDTFGSKLDYPSGGADGDALIKSGTSAAWGAAGGLTLIATESFSAVSSVSINGCFTSTYDNYRLMLRIPTASTSQTITFRYRASGTDNSSAYQTSQSGSYQSTTVFGGANAGQSAGVLGFTSTNDRFGVTADILSPQNANSTIFAGLGIGLDAQSPQNADTGWRITFIHTGTNVFDGLSVIASSGTITGTLRIYGYRD
jgi:hypothetical protein